MRVAAVTLRESTPAPPITGPARSTDWRFLLPTALRMPLEQLVVCGGSPRLAAAIREQRIAAHVTMDPSTPVVADAVIALAGTTASPRELAAHVADNGALYWEIDRRTPGQLGLTPARAFDRLAAQGLTPTAAYWVKPGFPDRHMYLPVASRGAFRWYLKTLYGTHTRRRRVLKRLLGAVAAHGRLGTFAPCYAVTAVRGAARPPAFVEMAGAEESWRRGNAHPVLLAHTAAEWSRVALLLFGTDEAKPSSILKFPRTTTFNRQIEWEHGVLQTLRATLPPSLRSCIPSSQLGDWNELAVVTESYVTGATLSSRVGLATVEALDDLHLAATWLAAFHCQTTVDRATAREWLTRHLVNGLCRQYAETFVLTEAEAHLFGVLRRALETCPAASLPLAWQHTDFGPWNVYRDAGDVRVIDWEVARIGPVLSDLLYFATHWGAAVARRTTDADRLEHFATLFCSRAAMDPVSRAIRADIADYMHRVGLHWSLFPYVLVYTFLEQALELSQRLTTVGGNPTNRAANLYASYVNAVAQHADSLFRGDGRDGH